MKPIQKIINQPKPISETEPVTLKMQNALAEDLRGKYNKSTSINKAECEKFTEAQIQEDLRIISKYYMNIKFNPVQCLEIKENSNLQECFQRKVENKSIEIKRLATLSYDCITTKQKNRYKNNPDGTVSLAIYSYYEAALVGDDTYFLYNNSAKLLDIKGEHNRGLLYTCARSGYGEAVFQLLRAGCDVNQVEENGSTPLHVASYYGHIEVVKILLAFGASNKIINKFGFSPQNEAMNDEIKNLFEIIEQDNILNLFTPLKEMGLAFCLDRREQDKVIRLYKRGKNGKCLISSIVKDPNFERTYHGTKFKHLTSIFKNGLKMPNQKVGDHLVEINYDHIQKGVTYFQKENWSDAIFVSPSPFYATNPTYAERIFCNGRQYCCLVEALILKGFFDKYNSSTPSHKKLLGEPDSVEYRADQSHLEKLAASQSNFFNSLGKKGVNKKNQQKEQILNSIDFDCGESQDESGQDQDQSDEGSVVTVFSILFIDVAILDEKQYSYDQVIKMLEQYDFV